METILFFLFMILCLLTTFPGGVFVLWWGLEVGKKFNELQSAKQELRKTVFHYLFILLCAVLAIFISNVWLYAVVAWFITVSSIYYMGKSTSLLRVVETFERQPQS